MELWSSAGRTHCQSTACGAAAVGCELGRAAGFVQARQIFVDPTDFFRLFRFDPSTA
jgi:hypothetical protein